MEFSHPNTSSTNVKEPKTHKNWTLQDKLEAVKKRDAGTSIKDIAVEYSVHERVVRRWIHDRETLEKHSTSPYSKRVRLSPVEKVNEALTVWFYDEKKRNNPISVIQVKAKALELFREFGGMETFKASDGWFRHWKQRNGIHCITSAGEQLSSNSEAANKFKNEILELMETEKLTSDQIFNAVETGLYYKMMPKETTDLNFEHISPGFKRIKDRLTVLTCCNANGSLKMPLLVIGRYEKPRALKNLAPQLLPVTYTSEQNACMSTTIFERWFKEEFVPSTCSFLKWRGLPEKAILLLDNTRSHSLTDVLSVDGIKAVFFPSNVASLIQPLDQGIIDAVKRRYKAKLLRYVLNAQTDGMDFHEAINSFNIRNAVALINESWNDITEITISNCWKPLLNMPIEVDDSSDHFTSEYIYEMCTKIQHHEDIELDHINEWIHAGSQFNLSDEESEIMEDCNSNENVTRKSNKKESNKPSTSSANVKKQRTYKNWSLQDKLEAVKKIDTGASIRTIAIEYNVHESVVRKWIHDRETLEKHRLSTYSKRVRLSPVEKVNEALTIWFYDEKKRKNSISISDVKAKALEFFKEFGGMETFKASDGWFRHWKQRNGIRFIATSEGHLSTNSEAVDQFKKEIAKLIKAEQLTLDQIFNADVTELYFKMMPDKTSVIKTDYSAPRYNKIKEGLTVLTCCNANGSLKIPLLVIGHYPESRTLKDLAPRLSPVTYTSETNARMSAIIFERWFKEQFVPSVRTFLNSRGLPEEAIILLDNTKSHSLTDVLTVDGIRAISFPPNVIPIIQPLDQGIIEAIKRRYKAKLLTFVINAQADGIEYNEAINSFDIKHAIDLISESWDDITEETISNCWKPLLNMPIEIDDSIDHFNSEHILEICKKISYYENVTLEQINKWIHADSQLILTDKEIIAAIEGPLSDETVFLFTVDIKNDQQIQNEISPSKAMESLNCVISFLEKNEEISLSDMETLKRIRERLLKIRNNT
ncbi:uncharacterized protein LOC117222387 isoform X3 [Megalopta genalis]